MRRNVYFVPCGTNVSEPERGQGEVMDVVEQNRQILSAADTRPAARIVQVLRERGALSSAELARISGLGKATISRAVSELRRSGVLIDAGRSLRSERLAQGRPGNELKLNPEAGVCIGIAIGPRDLHAVLADVSHAVLGFRSSALDLDYAPQAGIAAAREMVAELLSTTGLSGDRVLGIGVAVGGPVHPESGKVSRSSLIPAWTGIPIGKVFQQAFNRPVFVDNEANCCALAEIMWGAAAGHSDVLYLKLDQGVGGAVIVNGNVSRGVSGGAGEFGHITFDANGPFCRCGNRGCYELYAAGPVLLRQLGSIHGPDLTVAKIIEMAKGGDTGCRRAIVDIGTTAGQLAALLCNAFNPERVIVGGELSTAGEILFDSLKASFGKHVLLRELPDGSGGTEIVPGTSAANEPALGAIGLVLKHLGQGSPRRHEKGGDGRSWGRGDQDF